MRKTDTQGEGILFSWDSSIQKGDVLQTNDGKMYKVVRVERPHLVILELKNDVFTVAFKVFFWLALIGVVLYLYKYLMSDEGVWFWDKLFDALHSFGLF